MPAKKWHRAGVAVALVLLTTSAVPQRVVSSAPYPGSSARIVRVSGEEISGVITKLDSSGVTFADSDNSVMVLPWTDIQQIAFVRETGNPAPSQNSAVPKAKDDKTKSQDTPDWVASIQPKGSFSVGTQTVQTLGAQIVVKRTQHAALKDWRHQATTLTLDANNQLTEQSGSAAVRTHEYDGDLNHLIYFRPRVYGNIIADAYHNSSLDLYLEQFYGAGLGGILVGSTRQTLSATADVVYIGEHFASTPSARFAAARLSENFARQLTKPKKDQSPVLFSETFSFFPAFNHSKAWQFRAAGYFIVPLSKTLSANFGFFDNYIENPSNKRKNYSSSSIGVSYSFPPSE